MIWLILALVAAAVIVPVWLYAKALSKELPGIREAQRVFTETLGYRPVGELTPHDRRFVRTIGTSAIEFHETSEMEGSTWVRTASWRVPMASSGRVVFQIADRRLLIGAASVIKATLTRQRRTFQQRFPLEVRTRQADLDARFAVFGEHPEHLEQVLSSPQGLALLDLLRRCHEVDLVLSKSEISFADPGEANALAICGNYSASVLALEQARLKVHELVGHVLVAATRLSG